MEMYVNGLFQKPNIILDMLHLFYLPDVYLYLDRLCGLVVRVPGYRTEMYCVSCEVRNEFIYVM
jgi:hypothetical protein